MDFLSVILAYLVSISLSGHGEPATAWVLRWRAHLVGRDLGAKLTMVIYALLPALLVACLQWWVDNFIFNLVLSVTLLLLAFQSGDQPENLAYTGKFAQPSICAGCYMNERGHVI